MITNVWQNYCTYLCGFWLPPYSLFLLFTFLLYWTFILFFHLLTCIWNKYIHTHTYFFPVFMSLSFPTLLRLCWRWYISTSSWVLYFVNCCISDQLFGAAHSMLDILSRYNQYWSSHSPWDKNVVPAKVANVLIILPLHLTDLHQPKNPDVSFALNMPSKGFPKGTSCWLV